MIRTTFTPGVRHLASIATAACVALAGCGGPRIPAHPRPIVIADAEQAVAAFYRRINAEDLEGVLAFMVREPTLVEPFTRNGEESTAHHGYREVGEFFARAFHDRDDETVPEYIRADGNSVTVGWSMHGSDGAGMSGVTHIEMERGLIARVVVERRD